MLLDLGDEFACIGLNYDSFSQAGKAPCRKPDVNDRAVNGGNPPRSLRDRFALCQRNHRLALLPLAVQRPKRRL